MRSRLWISGVVAAVLVATVTGSAAVSTPAPTWSTYRSDAGVVFSFPSDWHVAGARSGLIVLAGPAARWGRPIVTATTQPGTVQPAEIIARAAHATSPAALFQFLGTQHFAADRLAQYYVRRHTDHETQDAYMMIGAIAGRHVAVTLIGVDPLADPELRLRARVFQTIVLRSQVP